MARLKSYKARLILFPRKGGQHKKLDSSKEDVEMANNKENYGEKIVRKVRAGALAIDDGTGVKHGFKEIKKSEVPEGEENAYAKLRKARSDARLIGVREKRAKVKAEAEESKKK